MEKENEKMTMEDKIKIIDDLIEDEQEAIDQYNKAVDKLKGNICPKVLEMLGSIYQDEVRHIAMLENVKEQIKNYGLGNTYADEAFRIFY